MWHKPLITTYWGGSITSLPEVRMLCSIYHIEGVQWMFHDSECLLGNFHFYFVYHFPIDVQGNLIQLPEVAHGDAMIGQSLPTLPPRGWKSSPSQLVVVRWPDHYKKKLLEALEKHLLSWQEPMTSALPSPFLPFLMHMDCPGLVGHFIISEGKRQTAETPWHPWADGKH